MLRIITEQRGDTFHLDLHGTIERYFAPIPAGGRRPPLPPMDVPPSFGGPLRAVVADEVALPRLFLAFRSPVFGSDAYYAASVAGAILGMRKGSRLHRALVRDRQVAADANVFTYDLAKGSDLLVVDVTARPEVSGEQLEREVGVELDRIHRDGVTAAEVERAVALIETDFVAAMQSASERADQLSRFATYFGDPSLVNAQVEKYRAVTAAAVSAFARERLGADNRASLLFVPRVGAGEGEGSAPGEEREAATMAGRAGA